MKRYTFPRGRSLADKKSDTASIVRIAVVNLFAKTVEDLVQTIVSAMGTADRLVLLHHPHLERLTNSGMKFNSVLSSTVQEIADRYGVRYYDAVQDLKSEFGAVPQDYYIPDDMHFNAIGTRAYAIAVAKYLAASVHP